MRVSLIERLEDAVREVTDPLFGSYFRYSLNVDDSQLEVKVQRESNANDRTLALRVLVNHEDKLIGISNIFIPTELRHCGHGKRIISKIFGVAVDSGYELYIIDLVPSFHRRLIAREAVHLDDETVQITASTDLSHRFS